MASFPSRSSSQPNQGKPLTPKTAPSRVNRSNPGGAPSGSTPQGGSKTWTDGKRTPTQGGSGVERNSPKSFGRGSTSGC